ncbi:hypothetical protein QAO71_10595 [Halopseudomonas sp. SMJS2]|uniref:hypothetical protein n=1 Tax=Halopseudomonas sp. SMJS2 TaxID=3041098 RepID=UPI002452A5C9|nr:hypothetical protein [Halopseudomonas sp. SMJS2]WGK60541.1 hypothetical protein QAO71_10595 [Halopseudomonas sp. SMJS2]
MDKEQLEMVCVYLVPPAAFALAAIYWLSRITPQQMTTGTYPLALGAVVLGMGLTLIGAFVVLGKLKKGREG